MQSYALFELLGAGKSNSLLSYRNLVMTQLIIIVSQFELYTSSALNFILNFYYNSCFHKHSGVFFGAFLVPIFVVMLFNVFVFIWVTIVLIRHTKGQFKRSKESINKKNIVRRVLSVCGIMFLFGLTWLFAALTINIDGNEVLRITFQTFFVVTASFQGFFIFLFFCVLKKEARDSWREVLLCGKHKHSTSKLSGVTLQSSKTGISPNQGGNLYDSVNVKSSVSKMENDTTSAKDKLTKEDVSKEIPLSQLNDVEKDTSVSTFKGNEHPQVILSETKADRM